MWKYLVVSNNSMNFNIKKIFNQICDSLFSQLLKNESLAISLEGESSLFCRVNGAKIRQIGQVDNNDLSLELSFNNRRVTGSLSLCGDFDIDFKRAVSEFSRLRNEVKLLPIDPFIVLPVGGQSSEAICQGEFINPEQTAKILMQPMQGCDLSGILASGVIYRGNANSAGSQHWFSSDSFSFDYSLINPQERMVKATYAGSSWSQTDYQKSLASSIEKLKVMGQSAIKLTPGNYRTFIASAGVSDLLDMFSWHGLSELSMQTGESAFLKMRNEGIKLSPMFTFAEDFRNGLVPRFNKLGEVSDEHIELITHGELKSCLISSRTAKEYSLQSNFANKGEELRSPVMACGDLPESEVLQALGTGVYISNLHYLNWSDLAGGRITGMTRYACFWVEDGVIRAPIENMRFDDSFYHFFGDNLQAVTHESYINPDVGSYGGRALGMMQCPGILLSSFALTL
jgi:predicted Zn-dependent protease